MPGFMRSSENKLIPDIVSRQQLRIKGLEQTVNMATTRLKQSTTRENILSNELYKANKTNSDIQFTFAQLKIKLEAYEEEISMQASRIKGLTKREKEYEKALNPETDGNLGVHEPIERPSVRWVTYRSFRQLEARLKTAQAELTRRSTEG